MGKIGDAAFYVTKVTEEVSKVGSPTPGISFTAMSENVGVARDTLFSIVFLREATVGVAETRQMGGTKPRSQSTRIHDSITTSAWAPMTGVWTADTNSASIYEQYTADGSLMSSFATPAGATNPTGVGVDSNESIWFCDSDAASIYKTDQTGSVITQLASPSSNPYGVEYDGNGYLYVAESHFNMGTDYSSIYKMSASDGSLITSFTGAGRGTTGLGMDANRSLWVGNQRQSSLYQVDNTGSTIASIASPSNEPRGVGVDGDGCIWNADVNAASVYQLNTSGSQISSLNTPSNSPFGVGLDDAPLL